MMIEDKKYVKFANILGLYIIQNTILLNDIYFLTVHLIFYFYYFQSVEAIHIICLKLKYIIKRILL